MLKMHYWHWVGFSCCIYDKLNFAQFINPYYGTCLIRHTKGPGKCVGLYRMSEYSGFILFNRNTLGPLFFVGCRKTLVLDCSSSTVIIIWNPAHVFVFKNIEQVFWSQYDKNRPESNIKLILSIHVPSLIILVHNPLSVGNFILKLFQNWSAFSRFQNNTQFFPIN